MKDDTPRRVVGPAVAAFDAEIEAVESGVLFTPEQWSFAKRDSSAKLPAPTSRMGRGSAPTGLPTLPPITRAWGSILPFDKAPMRVTQRIPAETLETLVEQCRISSRRPLAHTCPTRRK